MFDDNRKGEKLGWTLGWLGAFIWVGILSIIFLFQEKQLEASVGLLIFLVALACISLLSPWRNPSTYYWKLMSVLYLLVLLSIGWAIWSFGSVVIEKDGWFVFVCFAPFIFPFGSLGRKKWIDDENKFSN